MNIEALMKRGKSFGSEDPLYVLAKAVYDLQHEVKALKKALRTVDEEARDKGPMRIGGE